MLDKGLKPELRGQMKKAEVNWMVVASGTMAVTRGG